MGYTTDKKISVIVPVYNTKEFLEKCINSVIYQTYRNWELILVDDGSTDGSWKVCEKYSLLDNRIVAVKNTHGGVSRARNSGLKFAGGEYVTFLDSDDWINENFFEQGIKLCEELNVDIFIGGSIQVKNGNKICNLAIPEEYIGEYLDISSKQMKTLVEYNYLASCYAKIYKNSILGKTEFDESMNLGEDLKFVFDIMRKNPRIYAAKCTVYNYRRGHESLTHQINEKKCKSVIATSKILFDVMKERNFEDTEFGYYVKTRYQKESSYILGVVLHENISITEKLKYIRILCEDPEKDGITSSSFIGLIKRHFGK